MNPYNLNPHALQLDRMETQAATLDKETRAALAALAALDGSIQPDAAQDAATVGALSALASSFHSIRQAREIAQEQPERGPVLVDYGALRLADISAQYRTAHARLSAATREQAQRIAATLANASQDAATARPSHGGPTMAQDAADAAKTASARRLDAANASNRAEQHMRSARATASIASHKRTPSKKRADAQQSARFYQDATKEEARAAIDAAHDAAHAARTASMIALAWPTDAAIVESAARAHQDSAQAQEDAARAIVATYNAHAPTA